MARLIAVWRSIASGLIRRSPQLLEEYERQPLIWNSLVLDIEGRRLGERTHIDWGFWDRGPAHLLVSGRSLDALIQTLCSSCLVYAKEFRLAFWR